MQKPTRTEASSSQSTVNEQRVFSNQFAAPRSVIERSIGKIKVFRKLFSGCQRFGDSQLTTQSMVVIATYNANLHICEKLRSVTDAALADNA